MRKGRILITVLLVLSGLLATAQNSVWNGGMEIWNNGSGSENEPYLIESAENLAFLAYMVNKGYKTAGICFRLTTDLDLGGDEDHLWEPIGLGDRWSNEDGCDRGVLDAGSSFCGHFDGGGHSIFNIYVDEAYTNAGLFGNVSGQNENIAVIENVYVVSGIVHGSNCGGIVGKGSFLQVSCCWNGATVEGNMAGGIMGMAENATINNCYNKGVVVGDGTDAIAGGLLGVTHNNVQMANSYNVGDISGVNYSGCLVGNKMDGVLTVENCHYLDACSQGEYGMPQSDSLMRTMEFVNLLNSQNPELVWAFDANNINEGFPILAENVFLVEVMANPTAGGLVQGNGVYSFGTSVSVTATANVGFTFINWTKNGEEVSTNPTYSLTVTETECYVANFSRNNYEITAAADPVAGGEIIGFGTYYYGDTVTLNAVSNEHYLFQQWTENDEIVSDVEEYTFVVAENRDFIANFILKTYEVMAEANQEGTGIVVGAGTYHYGDTVTMNAFPYEHYVFQNWTENGEIVSETETFSFMIDQSHDLIANFIYFDNISDTSSSVKVFPNPAQDVLFIKGEGIRKVTVLNMMGQVMDAIVIDGQEQTQINIKNYAAGVFLVKAHLKRGDVLMRFVKQ